jgi:hypothetical protein
MMCHRKRSLMLLTYMITRVAVEEVTHRAGSVLQASNTRRDRSGAIGARARRVDLRPVIFRDSDAMGGKKRFRPRRAYRRTRSDATLSMDIDISPMGAEYAVGSFTSFMRPLITPWTRPRPSRTGAPLAPKVTLLSMAR